jgi:arylsulfatase A
MKRFAILLCLACVLFARTSLAADTSPMNVVVILVDDMGLTDVGCFGSKFYETPNIDKLAADGMKFTNAYSACTVCSPTRAAILTGQYPARLHITDWIPGHVRAVAKLKVPDWTMYLPLEQPNIAKSLKGAGYATASIGKWHLGDENYFPDKQGFDINIGGSHKGQPPAYFSPYKIGTLLEGPAGEFLSDRLTDEAIKFVENNKDKHFFVYLPHFAVHQPIAGKKDVIEKYKKKDQSGAQHNAVYAALVESVDDSVGRIVAKLDELKLSGKTLLIFTSDNGGLLPVTSNLGLRAGKGSAYEGGVRVPFIARCPGMIKPSTTCDTPIISQDLHPTIMEVSGMGPAPGDGVSLLPLFKQTGPISRDALYWHYPHYHPGGAKPYGAIRAGDFRLVEFYETGAIELYNLKDDVAEKNDLSQKMPEKAAQLKQKLEAWRKQVGAQMPTLNQNYDAAKDANTGGKKTKEE